jgi:hypothetical protein
VTAGDDGAATKGGAGKKNAKETIRPRFKGVGVIDLGTYPCTRGHTVYRVMHQDL